MSYSEKINNGLYKSLKLLPVPTIAEIETINDINIKLLLFTYYSYNDHLKTYSFKVLTSVKDAVENNIYAPAAAMGNIELVKHFATCKEINMDNINKNKNTPFLIASMYGQIDILKYFVESKRVNIHYSGFENRNAILCATCFGQLDTIKYLESVGIDYNAVSALGRNAFFTACEINNLEIVKHFESKNDMNFNLFDNDGMTAYLFAAAKGYTDILTHLRNNKKIDLTVKDKKNNSNAFLWAASGEHTDAMNIVSRPTATQTLISVLDLYAIQTMQQRKNSLKLKKWIDESGLYIKQ